MKTLRAIFLFFPLIWGIASASETHIGGLATFVAKNAEEPDLTNVTSRGWSNFNTSRLRLFVDGQVTDNITIFSQTTAENAQLEVVGIYAKVKEPFGAATGMHIGIIPTPIGSFPARSYTDRNTLIGAPLMYIHRSAYAPGFTKFARTTSIFAELRKERDTHGMMIIYDECWSSGVELFGSSGKTNYSFAALVAAVSAPTMQGAQRKNIPQFTTRWTYAPSPALIAGFSGYYGPYLSEGSYDDTLPIGKTESDYGNGGICYELSLAQGYFELVSEGNSSWWDTPYWGKLRINTGYVETKYTFTPGWYLASRYDVFLPGEVTVPGGERERWDYRLHRYEWALAHKPNRRTLIKLGAQFNRFGDGGERFNSTLYALQASFRWE